MQGDAAEALAAYEVGAGLRGRSGYTNAHTEKVDKWVAEHLITPSPELIARGNAVIDHILGADSELRELWDEAGDGEWQAAVANSRTRRTVLG